MLDNYDDYKTGGTHKVFSISVVGENITITNENLRTESIVLDEELCSSTNLKFGSCGTSKFTAEIANVFENFEGKLINVTVTMDNEVTKYGTFKVFSDKPIADRIFRSLTAYDAMNDIIKTNVLSWYNSLTFPMTLKNFRDSFFNYLGITQETTTLVNDNFIIPGGFTASDSLMGGTIITAICELNGVFGHINRDGKFEYIDLTQSESFECPPYENGSVTYEDYVTSPITKVTMRGTASDVGTSVGVAGNEYIIQGNPLIYGTEGTQALTTAITNLLNKIKTIVFRPFDLRKTIGNPCVEIGDAIEIETKYETVNSYVLRRTLTGIQALRDRYSALGSKVYPAEATSYQNEITRAKGKMHEFEVTLDGFSSRVAEVESDVEGLDSDLHTNYSTTTQMNSAINQKANEINQTVSTTYETKSDATSKLNTANTNAQGYATQAKNEANASTDSKLTNYYTKTQTDSAITQKANEITLNVSENYTTKTEFGNLEIGGTNLITDSSFNTTIPLSDKLNPTSKGFSYYGLWAANIIATSWLRANIKPLTNYIISFDYEVIAIESGITDARSQGIMYGTDMGTSWTIDNPVANRVVGFKKHCERAWTTGDDVSSAIIYWYGFYSNSNHRATLDTIRITNLKLEEGNKATDWSPAPEDTETNAVNTAKSYTDAQLQITSSSILSTVEQGYTSKTEFSNLQIGGENRFAMSELLPSSKWSYIGSSGDGTGTATINKSNDGSNRIYQLPDHGYWEWKPKASYVISIEAKGNGGILNISANGLGGTYNKNYNLTNEWVRYSYIVTAPNTNIIANGSTSFYNKGSSVDIQVRKPKIEYGNKPTDWSPAPEDMSSKSEVEQLANKVAVKVNSSGRLVTAELGVDPSSATSYVKVKADDIDIIANGNIQLTGKSIGITSTNFSVTPAGVVTCSNITATGGSIGGWDISSTDLHKDFTSLGYGVAVSNTAFGRYDLTAHGIDCGFLWQDGKVFAIEGQIGKIYSSGAYYIDGIANVFHGDTSFPSGNIKVNKLVPVSGSTVNINNAMTVNSNGEVSATTIYANSEFVCGSGIELGTHAKESLSFIDFHWNTIMSGNDFTARIVQRAENTVDLFGKDSSTWGIWRAASFNSQSSKYVKKNIKDVTEKEARNILKLRPVKFDYKNSDLTNQRGLIAEEVLEIMPEMVNVPKDYTGFNKDEPWNTPSIDYSKFVPYLIKMIQIQQKQIDGLKK